MNFKRARSDEQIKSRIDEIISAASKIYDEVGYENLTFSAISEITNFTRPTIYKYFSTKEEILLKILSTDLDTWVNNLVKSFKLNMIYNTKEIVHIWAGSYSSHIRLLELYSRLFTRLEKNVSLEALVEFKKSVYRTLCPVYELLYQLFPKASHSEIHFFITIHLSVLLGLYPMCHPSETQKKAVMLANSDLPDPKFEETFEKALFQLMYFLENKL